MEHVGEDGDRPRASGTEDEAGRVRHVVRPPGLHRLGARPAVWVDEDGARVDEPAVLDRLRLLALPPAWTHVWASSDPDSPIQATGVDARGRTQYRYSAVALAASSTSKFDHLVPFAAALPALRARIDVDLGAGADGATAHPSAVTAAVLRFLDRGLIRVGNERYARDNHTYGLTTLRRGQVAVEESAAVFDFVGKEHVQHHVRVVDGGAARVLRALLAEPGGIDDLVFTTAATPHRRRVDSVTVNSYIHAHGAVAASAKVFRTWGATVAAAAVTAGATSTGAREGRRRADLLPYDVAAALLGNTPTVARQSYVHPRAIEIGRTADVRDAVERAALRQGSTDVRDVLPDEGLQATVARLLAEAPADRD